MTQQKEHYFGRQRTTADAKVKQVNAVFSRVSNYYDRMNDAMSLGVHRLWKRAAVDHLRLRPHHQVLDCATGSGDLTALILKRYSLENPVTCADINPDMLTVARRRLLDEGFFDAVRFVTCDAAELPFEEGTFDRIIIAFGIRNVTHQQKALAAFYRVLRPGGRLVVLEFSRAQGIIAPLYEGYLRHGLPLLGNLVADDEESYRYLAESIERHPDQDTFAYMMTTAKFEAVRYHNLTAGVVAIHVGDKY